MGHKTIRIAGLEHEVATTRTALSIAEGELSDLRANARIATNTYQDVVKRKDTRIAELTKQLREARTLECCAWACLSRLPHCLGCKCDESRTMARGELS